MSNLEHRGTDHTFRFQIWEKGLSDEEFVFYMYGYSSALQEHDGEFSQFVSTMALAGMEHGYCIVDDNEDLFSDEQRFLQELENV